MRENTDYRRIKEIKKAKQELELELDREPTFEEISNETGIMEKEIKILDKLRIDENEEEVELELTLTIRNNNLKKARLEKKMNLQDLAEKTGIGPQTIGNIEKCIQFPTEEQAETIAIAMGKQVKDIFPQWLQIFSNKWKMAEHKELITLNQTSLNTPEAQKLLAETDTIKDVTRNMLREKLKPLVAQLTPREQAILKMRFGLEDELNFAHTLEETGCEFGVTRTRIMQLEARALEKLQKMEGFDEVKDIFKNI